MATTNPVKTVLVTSGNQAPLAKDKKVDELKNGQIGIFNAHTGLSVDGTVLGNARDIFLAVGINRTTGGTDTMEDFNKSAGQVLQVRNARAYTVKGYVGEVQKVVAVTGFDAKCETDYALKVNIDSPQNFQTNGYNFIAKTYNYKTGCCAQEDCVSCPEGDCNELAVGMVANINADAEKLFIASLFANKLVGTVSAASSDGNATVVIGTETFVVPVLSADTATQTAAKIAAFINTTSGAGYKATSSAAVLSVYPTKSVATPTTIITTSGAGVTIGTTSNVNTTITDVAAFKAAYPGACLSIKITNNPEVRPAYSGNINVLYHKTGLSFNVSLVEGFTCNGTATTITEFQAKEGSGYDLAQLEYSQQGNGSSPYKTRSTTGLEIATESFVSKSTNYNVISLAYDQFSVAGWAEHLNNLETIIAIPCASTTTLTGLVAMLDPIFAQFSPMANDVADMDCTNTNTSTINDYSLDGIESLA
jgi:hypothetical protein